MEMLELKKKNDDELKKMLLELQEKLRQLRFEVANLQLKDVRDIRETRKDISRIQTILQEHQIKNQPSSN